MHSEFPKVGIIVLNWNGWRDTIACIESIRRLDYANYRLYVVDNASADRTAVIAKKYPLVRVVAEPKKGLTYARERGLLSAKGELLSYLDADSRISSSEWFALIHREFTKNPRLVSLSGPYHYYDLPQPTHPEAAEATRCLDLTEHRLHDPFPQAVHRAPPSRLEFRLHLLLHRLRRPRLRFYRCGPFRRHQPCRLRRMMLLPLHRDVWVQPQRLQARHRLGAEVPRVFHAQDLLLLTPGVARPLDSRLFRGR